MAYQNFIDLSDLSKTQARQLLDDAHQRKAARAGLPKGTQDPDAPLSGYVMAMIFGLMKINYLFKFLKWKKMTLMFHFTQLKL